MNIDEVHPALNHMIEAIKTFGDSEEPNETGYQIANQTSHAMYTELSQYPERVHQFGEAMMFLTSQRDFDIQHLVRGYDWSQFLGGTVVDIGGGLGSVSQALAVAYSSIQFIVQDLPDTIQQAKSSQANGPNACPNVNFMAHDFFTPQTIRGAEIYLLRWILHNWSDKYCTQILRNLVPALRKGSRVLLYEHLLPEGASTSWSKKGYPGARCVNKSRTLPFNPN